MRKIELIPPLHVGGINLHSQGGQRHKERLGFAEQCPPAIRSISQYQSVEFINTK